MNLRKIEDPERSQGVLPADPALETQEPSSSTQVEHLSKDTENSS